MPASEQPSPRTLFVCVRDRRGKGASCAGRGALTLLKTMRAALATENIGPDELALRPCGCLGLCKQGPVMLAASGDPARERKPPKPSKKKRPSTVHTHVEPDELRSLLRETLLGPF